MTTITDNGLPAALNQPSASEKTPKKSNGMLDQSDFLRLMTTQMTTQDPFNPIDNQQMVAQMAQFSSVAGIAEMNKSLSAIAEQLSSNRLTDAASWIGRKALVESEQVMPLSDGSYSGEVAIAKDAEQVNISLVDENGAVVHSQQLGVNKAGTVSFAWDGKNAAGEAVATGKLKMIASATTGGKSIETGTAAWTQIAGIQSPASGGGTQLVTALGLLSPDAAIRLV